MRKFLTIATITLSLTTIAFNPALSQNAKKMDHATHSNQGTMDHQSMMKSEESALPTEGGQAGFSTIAEIVLLLKNDPKTDWSKVDIDDLREHLVDMNELTLNASSESSIENGAITFNVSGQGRALKAVQAMVPAHSKVLSKAGLYNVTAEKTETGAIMRIAYENDGQLAQIKALGFFGIMATGAHHQKHHLQMARGNGHDH